MMNGMNMDDLRGFEGKRLGYSMEDFRKQTEENLKRFKEQEDAYLKDPANRKLIEQKRKEIEMALAINNKYYGTSLRISVPMLDAMLFALASVPLSIGIQVATNQNFVSSQMAIRCLRRILIEEREAAMRSAAPGLSTGGYDDTNASGGMIKPS